MLNERKKQQQHKQKQYLETDTHKPQTQELKRAHKYIIYFIYLFI